MEHAGYVNKAAKTDYGHIFPMTVQTYLDSGEAGQSQIEALRAELAKLNPETNPQLARVFVRFTLMASYGTWLEQAGILPWKPGTASASVMEVYNRWKAERGDGGLSYEAYKAVTALTERTFALDARFEVRNGKGDSEPAFRDKLGIKRGNEIWMNDAGLDEILGDAKLKPSLLEYLVAGNDPDWELIHEPGKFQRTVPKTWRADFGRRAYCFVRRADEQAIPDSPEVVELKRQVEKLTAGLATAEQDHREREAVTLMEVATLTAQRDALNLRNSELQHYLDERWSNPAELPQKQVTAVH
jgi:hypothetical protein